MRVAPIMTVPRYGHVNTQWIIADALAGCGLRCMPFQGVYYHECMENSIEAALDDKAEAILTIDFDSLFSSADLQQLISEFESGAYDALAARQYKRDSQELLGGNTDWHHFGLTLLRAAAFAPLCKPWFHAKPGFLNNWGIGRVQADVAFWRKWNDAGNSAKMSETVCIGHLEERVSWEKDGQYQLTTFNEWVAQKWRTQTLTTA